jgi:hypothetical protein
MVVDSADEVDRSVEQLRTARVTEEPVDAEFLAGRSAYLCDPERIYCDSAGPSLTIRSWPGSPGGRRRRRYRLVLLGCRI